MPLILGTNSIKDTGYDVANSCRFNDGSSDNLSRTTGTPSNRKKFTLSFWCKISGASGNLDPFGIHIDGNTALWLEVPNNGTKRFKFVDYRSGSENAKLEILAAEDGKREALEEIGMGTSDLERRFIELEAEKSIFSRKNLEIHKLYGMDVGENRKRY